MPKKTNKKQVDNDAKIKRMVIIAFAVTLTVLGCIKLLSQKTFTSEGGFFKITTPSKYEFQNLDKVEGNVMAMVDPNEYFYIFAMAFGQTSLNDFTGFVEKEYDYFINKGTGLSDTSQIEHIKVRGYEAAYFYYTYIDDNGDRFYVERYIINCKNGNYVVVFEAPKETSENYKADIKKIIKTFREVK